MFLHGLCTQNIKVIYKKSDHRTRPDNFLTMNKHGKNLNKVKLNICNFKIMITKDILLDRLYDACFGDCVNNVSRDVFKELYSPLSENTLVKPLIVHDLKETKLSYQQIANRYGTTKDLVYDTAVLSNRCRKTHVITI